MTRTYLSIWRQFNRFLTSLDYMPRLWEDRTTLFIGFLIDKGMQSSTVKSYISAIKRKLVDDGYKWVDDRILLSSLTRACKLINDSVRVRLPIQCGLLELILFEFERTFKAANQWYLELMYKALFVLGYYGLMRVGELTISPHVLRAKDIHIATNKDKILVVLYSSKTHDRLSHPQKIKITSNHTEKSGSYIHRHFCPFQTVRQFIAVRGDYQDDAEQFFIYRDRSPVSAANARVLLRETLHKIGIDGALYDMHSLRIGRTTDLIKYNYSIEEVKRMGRWKSNVIYKYIR